MTQDHGQDLIDRAFFLYRAGEFQQAYDLLTEAAPRYPEREQRLYAWRFNLAARLGTLTWRRRSSKMPSTAVIFTAILP